MEYKLSKLTDAQLEQVKNIEIQNQDEVVKNTGEKIDLMECYNVIKNGTDNFTLSIKDARDADEKLYNFIMSKLDKNYVPKPSETTTNTQVKVETPTPAPAPVEAASKPSDLVLKMRLKAIAKLMEKEPNSVVLKMRVKAVNKLLGGEKMRDGGNVGEVSFKDKKDSGNGFGLRTWTVRNDIGKWKIFSSSEKWTNRDEDMDFASKEDAIHTAKVMAGHIKEKY